MYVIKTRKHILSSAEDVFSVMTGFDRYPEWNPWLDSVELESDGGGVDEGAVVHARTSVFVPVGPLSFRVTSISAPEVLTWVGDDWFQGIANTERQRRLIPRTDGTVLYVCNWEIKGPLSRAIGMVYGPAVRTWLKREAEALKSHCEKHYYLTPGGQDKFHEPLESIA
jgi:hypothetical protein